MYQDITAPLNGGSTRTHTHKPGGSRRPAKRADGTLDRTTVPHISFFTFTTAVLQDITAVHCCPLPTAATTLQATSRMLSSSRRSRRQRSSHEESTRAGLQGQPRGTEKLWGPSKIEAEEPPHMFDDIAKNSPRSGYNGQHGRVFITSCPATPCYTHYETRAG